jgi:hypothetical protein
MLLLSSTRAVLYWEDLLRIMVLRCPINMEPYGDAMEDENRLVPGRFGVEEPKSSSVGDSTIGCEMGVEELRNGRPRVLSWVWGGPWKDSCDVLCETVPSPMGASGLDG